MDHLASLTSNLACLIFKALISMTRCPLLSFGLGLKQVSLLTYDHLVLAMKLQKASWEKICFEHKPEWNGTTHHSHLTEAKMLRPTCCRTIPCRITQRDDYDPLLFLWHYFNGNNLEETVIDSFYSLELSCMDYSAVNSPVARLDHWPWRVVLNLKQRKWILWSTGEFHV